MIVRGVTFNYAWDQSGLRNFDGRGYPYHQDFQRIPGFDFTGSTFVAKTATWESRLGSEYGEPGNMPLLSDNLTPAEYRPKCIHVSLRSWIMAAALNAVGLSDPGLHALLQMGIWQNQPHPFQISLMALAPTKQERLAELSCMVKLILQYKFQSKYGVQLNISCPNVDHAQELDAVAVETRESLAILRLLGDDVPLFVKIDARLPITVAGIMASDSNCDGLSLSNTINWAHVPSVVRKRLFGTEVSPLAKYGGGGLSGAKWLFEMVERWVFEAREYGIKKPIMAGGGVLRGRDVERLAYAGASGIQVGSVAFLRPWRVQKIIARINQLGQTRRLYPYG